MVPNAPGGSSFVIYAIISWQRESCVRPKRYPPHSRIHHSNRTAGSVHLCVSKRRLDRCGLSSGWELV